jgi:hypothetical protein
MIGDSCATSGGPASDAMKTPASIRRISPPR